jgi:hypothetical protein
VKDENSDALFTGTVRAAWEAFKVVVDNFLGKYKAPNYTKFVKNMLQTFRNMGCNMSNCTSFTIIWISFQVTLKTSVTSMVSDFNTISPPQKNATKRNGQQQCLPATVGYLKRETPATYKVKAQVNDSANFRFGRKLC